MQKTTLTFFILHLSPMKFFFTYAGCSFWGVNFFFFFFFFFFTYAGCSFSGQPPLSVTNIFLDKNCIFGQAFHERILSFKKAIPREGGGGGVVQGLPFA